MTQTTLPTKLYKYRPFNVNSLRLLSAGEVYYAAPTAFNDPLDCDPTIQVDTDRVSLEKLCFRMISAAHGEDRARREVEDCRYHSTQFDGDYKTDSEAGAYYIRLLASRAKDFLAHEMARKGVLSLAARWDCALMWSHYADDHRGICIEYQTKDHACARIGPVNYRHPRSVKVSDLLAWKIRKDSAAERRVFDTFFFAKASHWRYEKEWRVIYDTNGPTSAPFRISAVYFGLRCDHAVRTAIVKLLDGSQVQADFYDIYPLEDTFRLKRTEVERDEILACGVQSSVLLDFKEIMIDEK